MVGVALGGVVGVFFFAVEGVFGGCGAQAAFGAVEDGNADAEGSEIDAGYDGHMRLGKPKHEWPQMNADERG